MATRTAAIDGSAGISQRAQRVAQFARRALHLGQARRGSQRELQSLQRKRVTPHVLRHTTAMELLQAGVEQSVIALWLGHESIETTQIYLDADLELRSGCLR